MQPLASPLPSSIAPLSATPAASAVSSSERSFGSPRWASRRRLIDARAALDASLASVPMAAASADVGPTPSRPWDGLWHLAGRVVQLRRVGKVGFAEIDDGSARFQLMVRAGDPTLDGVWDACRRGDWVSAHGPLGHTRTGEPSLLVQRLERLQDCRADLPERFHGLTDLEQRRRCPEQVWAFEEGARRTLTLRAQVLRALRGWFEDQGYLEFETPVLHPIQGGANARPFVTHHRATNTSRYLRIAPELYLKRALVGGFDRVFEMARCFRNEGLSTRHRPEFTLVEAYRSFADVSYWLDALPDLLRTVARSVGSDRFDQVRRTTMDQACRDHGLDPQAWTVDRPSSRIEANAGSGPDASEAAWQALATVHGLPMVTPPHERLVLAFEEIVAPTLDTPTLVQGHPLAMSPLAAEDPQHPGFAARFELYGRGIELANGYTELTDPEEQRRRLALQASRVDGEAMGMDEAFLAALNLGLPPCAGVGIGVDRLVMLLAEEPSIQEVMAFSSLHGMVNAASTS